MIWGLELNSIWTRGNRAWGGLSRQGPQHEQRRESQHTMHEKVSEEWFFGNLECQVRGSELDSESDGLSPKASNWERDTDDPGAGGQKGRDCRRWAGCGPGQR